MPLRAVSNEAQQLIKRWEGLRLKPYRDAAGYWTVGFGHLLSRDKNANPGPTITMEQAEAYFQKDLARAAKSVSNLIKAPLTDGQYGALVSFVFNLGGGNLEISTLRKKVNANPSDPSIEAEFLKWINVRRQGKLTPLQGLRNRRREEAALYFQASPVASNTSSKSSPDSTQPRPTLSSLLRALQESVIAFLRENS